MSSSGELSVIRHGRLKDGLQRRGYDMKALEVRIDSGKKVLVGHANTRNIWFLLNVDWAGNVKMNLHASYLECTSEKEKTAHWITEMLKLGQPVELKLIETEENELSDEISSLSANKSSPEEKEIYCSFCGLEHREVEKIVAGPSAFICNRCVDLCNEIVISEGLKSQKEGKST